MGLVFGIATAAVMPPASAEREPVSKVSLSSLPGSRKCTCRSMSPGVTVRPFASIFLSAFSLRFLPTAAILPSRTNTSLIASTPFFGSITCPPEMRSVLILFAGECLFLAVDAVDDKPEERLAHDHAVLHLTQNIGLLVDRGECGVHVDIADDRAGVHEDGVFFGEIETLSRNAEHF